ncbi:MAG: hypothetical protein EOM64_10245 [Erysipelotrichia bacterium]|nr:hypothetical protein [Erysipelotrichia bacterium]
MKEAAEKAAAKKIAEAEQKSKKVKANLEEMASKNDYHSVFEKLANTTTKPKPVEKIKKKKRKGEEDDIKIPNKSLMAQLGKVVSSDIKPVYTEEELEEIEKQKLKEEEAAFDIDYDEYEDYYKDDQEDK